MNTVEEISNLVIFVSYLMVAVAILVAVLIATTKKKKDIPNEYNFD